MTETFTWADVELPRELPKFNGYIQRWKDEPLTPLLKAFDPPTTYDEAVKLQRALFEEQGLYRNNYHFLKNALRQARRRVAEPLRAEWQAVRETLKGKAWRNRRKHPAFLALQGAKAPYYRAEVANLSRWNEQAPLYEDVLNNKCGAWIAELHAKEEAERKAAEKAAQRKAAEEAKLRAEAEAAKRAASPHYDAHVRKGEENRRRAVAESEQRRRDWIATLQQMTDEEYLASVVSEEVALAKKQLGLDDLRAEQYGKTLIVEHRKRMAKWRASGKPLGEW